MSVEYVSKDALTELSRLQLSKLFNVASLAVVVFDYCLTFPSEVEYVWGMGWDVTRIIFTLSRYVPPISAVLTCYDALFNKSCGSFVLALDVMYIASIVFAEGILILRTYALWGNSKRVLFFLLFLAVAFITGAEVVSLKYKVVIPGDAVALYEFGTQFYLGWCAYGSPRNAALQYGFLLTYEIILQSMNSWRRFRTYRSVKSKTLDTLYWDGIMYMWWIILLTGVNTAVMVTAPVAYTTDLDTAQVAIHGLLACRIFFNLKECGRQACSLGEGSSLATMQYQARTMTDTTTQHTRTDVYSIA